MTPTESLKQELLREIEKLPADKLKEVLQFVGLLRDSENQHSYGDSEEQQKKDTSVSNTDPLSEFIGAVSHGSLAQNLDTELYDQETFCRYLGMLILRR